MKDPRRTSGAPPAVDVDAAIQRASAHKGKGNTAFHARLARIVKRYCIIRMGLWLFATLRRSIRTLPLRGEIWHALLPNRSLMCYHLGWYADAVSNADEAIDIHSRLGLENKEMAKAYFRRGQAKAKMEHGNNEDAKQDLKKAAELAPGDEAVMRELSYLR